MILRLCLYFFIPFCFSFSNAQSLTNTAFDYYLHKQDSLIRIAYEHKDAETQIQLLEDVLSKYEELADADKIKYKFVSIKSSYELACNYSLLNNKSKSLLYLKKSFEDGFTDFEQVKVDLDLNTFRDEQDFKELFSSAQKNYLDTLKIRIKKIKQDTSTIIALFQYAAFYNRGNNDSALLYFNKAYALALDLKNDTFQVHCLKALEQFYTHTGNFQKALELNFELLTFYEKKNDSLGIADICLELGGVYDNLGDFENSIFYNKKAYSEYKKLAADPWRIINSANNIGYKYTLNNLPDSALYYFQESNATANNEIKNAQTGAYAFTLYGLGKVNYQLKNLSIAQPYYKQSLASVDKNLSYSYGKWIQGLNYMGLGELFKADGHTDSAIVYYKKALTVMPEQILIPIIYRNLAELYKVSDMDLAFGFLMKEAQLRDSLHTANNKRDLKNLSLNEEQRQKDIDAKQKQETAERKQNIEYALLALGILGFIILFLLLSRSFITNIKLIEFFGVLALLLVFEFLNLLLHPVLEKITHHTPVLMLLVLVCIAGLLIPLHHRVEKWTTQKLVEKNKAVRLANAKKTIEKLS